MILYSVELELDAALRDDYRTWLDAHVAEMLTLPGFIEARVLTRLDPPPPAGRTIFVVHYRLRDRAAFDAYIAGPAAHMRAAGVAHFGDRVSASRRVLEGL